MLIEKRKDLRWADISAGRSINLALSDRGLAALAAVGLDDEARSIAIPMHGRMIHDRSGASRVSPYSGREEDYINSISRTELNALLLDAADRYDEVQIMFETDCTEIALSSVDSRQSTRLAERKCLTAKPKDQDPIQVSAEIIIGADGAGSPTRQAIEKLMGHDFKSDSHFLSSGYKELHIPPTVSGEWRIEKNVLHIWPRGSYMAIALPNLDGSFTVTLFWPMEGDNSFGAISTEAELDAFFRKEFPDLYTELPDLAEDYFNNPTGKLGTLKCAPWHYAGHACLIGDACHPIVPFYGQGMNAAFEDTLVFMECYDADKGDWATIFSEFYRRRKPDTDAIADLALDNFYEMQDHVDDPAFMAKRTLEMKMEQEIPSYYSKYGLVTFREDLPYREALRQGRLQDKILLDMCHGGKVPDGSLQDVYSKLQERLVSSL